MEVRITFKNVFIDVDNTMRNDVIITNTVERAESYAKTLESALKVLNELIPLYMGSYDKEPDLIEIG